MSPAIRALPPVAVQPDPTTTMLLLLLLPPPPPMMMMMMMMISSIQRASCEDQDQTF